VPGVPPRALQRCHTAGVDEFQPSQINDDIALARRDSRGVCYAKLPAQRNDNPAIAFAGTQIHANHGDTVLLGSKAGSGPSG
jgi:hypothetical protein